MNDLRLMHHWSTVTYLDSASHNAEAFRDYMVGKALQRPYLMDILLAFTALHKASKASGAFETTEHLATALYYQSQGLAELNRGQSVVNITRETCESVLIFTGLNTVCTFLALLVPTASGERLESLPEGMLRVRMCMLGLREVVEQSRSRAELSEMRRIHQDPESHEIEAGGLEIADSMWTLTATISQQLAPDDAATPLLQRTLENLKKAYVNDKGRSVFGWLMIVEIDFFHEVDRGNDAAMVILMCWGTLACMLQRVWWAKYAGQRIVDNLSSRLSNRDGRWDQTVQWCCQQMGVLDNI